MALRSGRAQPKSASSKSSRSGSGRSNSARSNSSRSKSNYGKGANYGKGRPRRRSADADETPDPQAGERLQKLLAAAGLGSRRACEELIETGRVEVDRKVVTTLGTRVDPVSQEIRVDGEPLPRPRATYVLVNKVQGVVSTASDPSGRPRVTDMVPPNLGRLFPVGRLDMSSEGLILLTNDGDLANRLTHPRYGVEKMYQVQVAGHIEPETLKELEKGIYLAEGVAKVVGASIKSHHKNSTILEMILDEGRNREIRRLLARVGHKVQRLTRVAMGPLKLGDVPPGAYRLLRRDEIEELKSAVEDVPAGKRATRRTRVNAGGSRKLLQNRKSDVGKSKRKPGGEKQPGNPGASKASSGPKPRTVIGDDADFRPESPSTGGKSTAGKRPGKKAKFGQRAGSPGKFGSATVGKGSSAGKGSSSGKSARAKFKGKSKAGAKLSRPGKK